MECDGATYHSSATARDRDKVREQVLRGLGWNILRVWSTDWWFDAAGCAERLHSSLECLLAESRSRRSGEEAEVTTHWDMGHEVEGSEEIRDNDAAAAVVAAPSRPAAVDPEFVSVAAPSTSEVTNASPVATSALAPSPEQRRNRVADLSAFRANPDQFFEFGYRETLRAMIESVVEAESPLRTDVLALRLARAHGWLRTGGRIPRAHRPSTAGVRQDHGIEWRVHLEEGDRVRHHPLPTAGRR